MPRKAPRTLSFTKAGIAKLEPPIGGREYHYDEKKPGLAVCVTSAGTKTFYLVRRIGSKVERRRIGAWPQWTIEQARDEADRLNGRVADGVNPNDQRRADRAAPTFGEAFDEYVLLPTRGKKKRPRSPKTIKDYKWQFKKYLSTWKTRRLSSISRSDVEKLHADIGKEGGPYIANRILALVKAVMNYAVEQGYCSMNPAARLIGFEEEARERYLQPHELPTFWKAVEAEQESDFFKLLLFCGVRRGNLLEARWSEVDFQSAEWKIPQTKNGKSHTVALSTAALEILNRRKQSATTEWVFPADDGSGPMAVPKHGWDRIRAAAGVADLRLHDLRHSLASWLAGTNTALPIIGRVLGHRSPQATARYAHVDLNPVRSAMETATTAIMAAAKPPKKKRTRKTKGAANE